MREVYRYTFSPDVAVEDLESSLLLSIVGVECLHGESQARLDIQHLLDTAARVCVIDASTDVGRDLARLFTGFLNREFGPDSFQVQRVNDRSQVLDSVSTP